MVLKIKEHIHLYQHSDGWHRIYRGTTLINDARPSRSQVWMTALGWAKELAAVDGLFLVIHKLDGTKQRFKPKKDAVPKKKNFNPDNHNLFVVDTKDRKIRVRRGGTEGTIMGTYDTLRGALRSAMLRANKRPCFVFLYEDTLLGVRYKRRWNLNERLDPVDKKPVLEKHVIGRHKK